MQRKVLSAEEAVALIHDGDMIATSGFIGTGVPEALLIALERRFLSGEGPRNLGLVFAAGQGDSKIRGLNHLGHDGLLRRVVGGHWGLIPKVAALALEKRSKPRTCRRASSAISIATSRRQAREPSTRVGLRHLRRSAAGGRADQRRSPPRTWSTVMEVRGEEYLFYKAFPIDVALIRGTTADEAGNVTMESEALTLDNLARRWRCAIPAGS